MLTKKELLSLLKNLDDEDFKVLIVQGLVESLRTQTQKELTRNLYYKYNHVEQPITVKSLITGEVVTLADANDFQQYLYKKGYYPARKDILTAIKSRSVICNHEVIDNNKNDYFGYEE